MLSVTILCSFIILGTVVTGLGVQDSPGQWVFTNLIEQNVASKQQHPMFDTGCECVDYHCGCCAHVEIDRINLNNSVCVNLTYLPQDYGMSFTLTIGNRTIYNETISVRSPPPLCIGVPYLKQFAELCIRFYNMDAWMTYLYGCVDFEARLHSMEVGKYDLGCFQMGKKAGINTYRDFYLTY